MVIFCLNYNVLKNYLIILTPCREYMEQDRLYYRDTCGTVIILKLVCCVCFGKCHIWGELINKFNKRLCVCVCVCVCVMLHL